MKISDLKKPKKLSISQLAKTEKENLTKALSPEDYSCKKMVRELKALKLPQEWKLRLSPSSFPDCQYQIVFGHLKRDEKIFVERNPIDSKYFMEVGQVIHTLWQKYLAHLGYLYGVFECSNCKQLVESQGTPPDCSCVVKKSTRKEWDFKEIDLHDPAVTELESAKADGLIRFPDMPEGHYFLLDFKSCGMHSLPKPEEGLKSQYHKEYLEQTAIYTHRLRELGFTIVGTILFFIPRDRPMEAQCIVIKQDDAKERYEASVKFINASIKASQSGDLRNVKRKCLSSLDDPDCPFCKKLCFNNAAIEQLFIQKRNLPVIFGE